MTSVAAERDELYAAGARRHREQQECRRVRTEWYAFFCRMADALRARAAEYDERAEILMEEEGKGA